MDHSEVREILEDAAIEPGGLERLMAGDTPTAALVAGHLAACPDCADEMGRLHRTVRVVRPVIRSVPPPELRERTLAYVAALGRPRGAALDVPGEEPRVEPMAGSPVRGRANGRRNRLPALAGLAAALLVAVGGTALVIDASRQSAARAQAAEIEALGDVARWTLRVDSRPDVRRVQLASTTGAATTASLVFSPTSTELVVVADQLARPPAGKEYRCWVEAGGARASIGRMYFGGDLAYWVGDVPEVAGLSLDAKFGVSLVDLGGSGAPAEPVLVSGG